MRADCALWYPDTSRLREVITFTAAQQANAVTAAEGLVDHQRPETSDVRSVIAAARLAFDRRPALFAPPPPGEVNAQDLVLDKVAKAVGDSSRADDGEVPPAVTTGRPARSSTT